ncbi:hypothetical protein [Mycobacteroides abscessus]|uniref:hypothetical protein n=1 Tax=Mycobacteroides abscessus TaxID=36809 RepID=UPI000E6A2621|nr:hypothetical protein [Mycobacteroides abscessus]RIS78132.1 hypothetical protein D2E44_23355 [Mycobacteroides abscessus]
MTSPWTGPVILTLCLSVLALLVSVTALVWQVISWRRSGARLHVATKWGIAGSPPGGRWFISIEARNTGRLATEINQVGFQMSKAEERRQILDFEDVLGMPIQLPRTLAAGGTTSVMYAADRLLATLHNEGLTAKDARPFVDTGAGRTLGRRKQDLQEMARKLIDHGTG